jgi:hypothetical protein
LEQAKLEFEKYKHRLNQSGPIRNHNQEIDDSTHGKNDKPQEIYVPTAAVLRNLQFMQSMSSESLWRAAPPSVRQRSVAPSTFLTAGAQSEHTRVNARQVYNKDPHNLRHHNKDNTPSKSQQDQTSPKASMSGKNPRHQSTDKATTICTTQSPLTRNTQTQSNIIALEDTIQRQQQEIRNMSLRFDEMDKKMEHLTTAIKSGEMNQNNTILQIQQQLDTVCTSLSFLVQQTALNQKPFLAASCPTPELPTRATEPQNPMSQASDINNENRYASLDTTTVLTSRSRSPMVKSPEKKKQRSNVQTNNDTLEVGNPIYNPCYPMNLDKEQHANNNTDQSGAQYNKPSPFDGANPD